ncbi:hypothetical protein VTJ49DRAFT_4073 [Mycothermus thermophilus]|uniref:Uncharacterized protein n=1 Tax=Humicola insolens TaxID=85995 RepID=A0ABR3V673_HUMIN
MRSPAIVSLLGGLASTALAAPEYDIPLCDTDEYGGCALPSGPLTARGLPRHAGLFRRDPEECPADNKLCTSSGVLPPELDPQTIPLVCGNTATSNSVTASYGPCPSDETTNCLLFDLSGTDLDTPKLQIKASPLTDAATFDYNDYCTSTSCAVPIDAVIENEGLPTPYVLCGPTTRLWIALQTTLDGDTCWADGAPISANKKKRSKCKPQDPTNDTPTQFSIGFTCPEENLVCCCCPPSTEEPPPPGKSCAASAWAVGFDGSPELKSLGCTDGPGYYLHLTPEEAAGSVLTSFRKLTADGEEEVLGLAQVSISTDDESGTCAQVIAGVDNEDPLNPRYTLGRLRAYIGCEDPGAGLGESCGEGSAYTTLDSACIEGMTSHFVWGCGLPTCAEGYYVVVYADVAEAAEEGATCEEYVCTD